VAGAEHARMGRISLGLPFDVWEDALFASRGYLPVDLTRDVVRASQALWAIPERADRLIAATAIVLECPLITRDAEIAKAANVQLVW